ncbi:uncharacterized protein LOC119684022 [Teleopsis dalmanni]|uniref:uncharacterized protein LOC119684022 n=1 Tax=Teleopsis dalmanni TaxID=139649 RepID=UPI0018CFA0A4|nr:uncharacterized protein LOC119684022 [Teleopsis dalmanni]
MPENKLILFFATFFIICCVNSAQDAKLAVNSNTTTTHNATVLVHKCGDSKKMVDECFNDLPPHLMEFLQSTKIAINEDEITSKCTVFDRGMKCFDEYTANCLPDKNLLIFKNNVEGAKNFFKKFCGDRDFQRDYLRHKDCFSYIQDDWKRCTRNFQNILADELQMESTNVTNKFMEFCCARYAYENCIYSSARYKCYKNSAKFARDTAKMLSDEKHFSSCRQYENALCNAGHNYRLGGQWPLMLGMLWLLLLCTYVGLCNNCK